MKVAKGEKKPHFGVANIERRRHPRFSIDLPIEYHHIHSPLGATGQTINASEGGLLVYLPERLELGQQLKMKLYISSGPDLHAIEMLAQVVWIDLHLGQEQGDYRTGVEFVDISPEHMQRLKSVLQNLSK